MRICHKIFHPRFVPGDDDCVPRRGMVGRQMIVATWTADAIFMSALLALAVLSLAVAAWIVRIEASQK